MPLPEEDAAGGGGTEQEGGLAGSVRRVAHLLLRTFHVRVELFGLELQEEALRLAKALTVLFAFLFLAAAGVLLASLTLVFAVWDDPHGRLVALGALSGLYLLGALGMGLLARCLLKSARTPFSETLHELKKDQEWMQASKKSGI